MTVLILQNIARQQLDLATLTLNSKFWWKASKMNRQKPFTSPRQKYFGLINVLQLNIIKFFLLLVNYISITFLKLFTKKKLNSHFVILAKILMFILPT